MNSLFQDVIGQIGRVLYGKEEQIKLALSCLIADGHLLIEDLPGMGKTTLAQALAQVLGLDYRRVQFTSDLLPGDILGVSVFDPKTAQFSFHEGAVFTQVLLADEINRSSPRTQSALLEAMEERQVTQEGNTRRLPAPFFVIATQNPFSQAGTYPLPESQLDRFLMCISLGYPSPQAERRILSGEDPRTQLPQLQCQLKEDQVTGWQKQVNQIHASDAILDYVQRLVAFTRQQPDFPAGLSPRGAMGLLKSARAWAMIHNRDFVLPDDIQAVLPAVVEHRVQGVDRHTSGGKGFSERLLQQVAVV